VGHSTEIVEFMSRTRNTLVGTMKSTFLRIFSSDAIYLVFISYLSSRIAMIHLNFCIIR
jgi:hypothetical protein